MNIDPRYQHEKILSTLTTLRLLTLFLLWRRLSRLASAFWHDTRASIYFPRGYLRLTSIIFLALAILINPIGKHPMLVIGLAGASSGFSLVSLTIRDMFKPNQLIS